MDPTDKPTPESARKALAAADAMARAGARRGVWPRWAVVVYALAIGAAITAFGLYRMERDLTHILILAGILVPAHWFRLSSIRRFGVMAQPTGIDIGLMVVLLLSLLGAAILPQTPGPAWLVWVFGLPYAILRIGRYELRRGAPPQTTEKPAA